MKTQQIDLRRQGVVRGWDDIQQIFGFESGEPGSLEAEAFRARCEVWSATITIRDIMRAAAGWS